MKNEFNANFRRGVFVPNFGCCLTMYDEARTDLKELIKFGDGIMAVSQYKTAGRPSPKDGRKHQSVNFRYFYSRLRFK